MATGTFEPFYLSLMTLEGTNQEAGDGLLEKRRRARWRTLFSVCPYILGMAGTHLVLSVNSSAMDDLGCLVRLTCCDAAVSLLMQVASCVNDWPFMGELGAKLG